jgi:hypothetical protein
MSSWKFTNGKNFSERVGLHTLQFLENGRVTPEALALFVPYQVGGAWTLE